MEKELRIYVGEEEWESWRKASLLCGIEKSQVPTIIPHHKGDGLTIGVMIWLKSKEVPSTLFHETQHALSSIYEYLGCEDEEEMKAYIAGYVNEKAHQWLIK